MVDKNLIKPELISTRDGYGKGLVELGKQNPHVVVLSADLTDSTRASYFKDKFPKRFIEVGIAEQNMMGIAAGMALSGKIPFVSSYAVFSPGRNWEQLRISVCYQKTNVKIAGSHTGISIGPDGATHQGLEDIAITRCLPNLVVLAPCDSIQTKKATIAAANYPGPVYLRFTKQKTPVFTTENTQFEIGKAQVLQEGKDVTIIACGPLVYQALMTAKDLEKEKISVEVINNHTIKPLDTATILKSVQKTHCLVTVEDHQIMGGMGSAVIESLTQTYAAPVTEMIGINDSFGESGKSKELMKKYHLDKNSIIKAVKKTLARKRRL